MRKKKYKLTHTFVEEGFIFDFTKFQTDWSNVSVAGACQRMPSEFAMNFLVYC